MTTSTDSGSATRNRPLMQLKPVDRGRDAWQVLLAAFVFESLFWGFPSAFGVFQAFYTSLPQFASESKNVAIIGTLAQSLYYLGAPASSALTKRLPRARRHIIVLGWALCVLGLGTASLADTVPTLIATQGFLYGLGFVLMSYPILDMVGEWWIERKGMAFGLISAASGMTGIVMPMILEKLLQRYGYHTTLASCSIAMAVLTAPLIPLLRARLPPSEVHRQARADWSFLRKPRFYFFATATLVQGLGFFIPPLFVSSYAIDIGLPSFQAALLLAVMGASQTIGQFMFGWLSDTGVSVTLLTSCCCFVAALATSLLWGLGRSFVTLLLYSLVYGFFAFGFGTLRVAMGRAVTTDQSAALATYSTFVFLQGVGSALVGPTTAALISGQVDVAEYGASKYQPALIFVATTSLLGGVIITVYPILKWLRIVEK